MIVSVESATLLLRYAPPTQRTDSGSARRGKEAGQEITAVDLTECHLAHPDANEHGDAKKEEFPDLLHPNKAGYAKWSAADCTA